MISQKGLDFFPFDSNWNYFLLWKNQNGVETREARKVRFWLGMRGCYSFFGPE